jgi:hypothetical protein
LVLLHGRTAVLAPEVVMRPQVVMCERVTSLTCPAGSNFTSGALYSDSQRDVAVTAEMARLAALKAQQELPLVYFDVAIKGQHVGRMQFVLFTKKAPRAGGHMWQDILCACSSMQSRHALRTALHVAGAQ